MSDPLSRFQAAVEVLVGDGCVKSRLAQAYGSHLSGLNVASLPKPLRPEFRRLAGSLTEVTPLNGEGPVAATVRKLSKTQASEHAAEIVALLVKLLAAQARRPAKAAKKDPGTLALVQPEKVPKFLTKH